MVSEWGELSKHYRLWPDSATAVAQAFPIYILSFMCHFNVVAMHNGQ